MAASLGLEPRKRLCLTRYEVSAALEPREVAKPFYVAASLGLEPRQRDPESLVLPLHHEAKSEAKLKAEFRACATSSVMSNNRPERIPLPY